MNKTNITNVLAIVASIAILTISLGVSTVSALPVQEQKVNANDITPELSYQQVSELLQTDKSFEDIEGLNLQIIDTNVVAVYSNEGANGNFVFQYMVTLKA